MEGHVFLLRGDLTKLYCDAWLMPTDRKLHVMRHWRMGVPGLRSDWKPSPPTDDWLNVARRVMEVKDWPVEEPRPWLVNTGAARGSRPVAWYTEGVRQFFEAVAPSIRQRRFTQNRAKPLVAVPLVGTGAGGAHNVAGNIVSSMLPTLYEAASKWDVDIALCVKEGPAYAAAVKARKAYAEKYPETRVWPRELSDGLKAKANKLAERARKKELVLFLGAGVSAGAGLPAWEELLKGLSQIAGIFPGTEDRDDSLRSAFRKLNYLDQARLIADCFQERGLLIGEEVARIISQRRHYAVSHAALAVLPVVEVVTTNYDSLFEIASQYAQDSKPRILPYDPAAPGNRWILKLHGCVNHPEDIVLTRSDYLRYDDRRAALKGIVQALLITRHMLFVGFSMTDDNFHRIIEEVRKAVRGDGRCMHCGSLDARDLGGGQETESQEKFGTVLSAAPNSFVQRLWDKDLDWFNFSDQETSEAYRLQEVFLDYLTSLSVSGTAYLMDSRYDDILSGGERRLRKELMNLVTRVEGDQEIRDTAAWQEFESLLQRFGKKDSL